MLGYEESDRSQYWKGMLGSGFEKLSKMPFRPVWTFFFKHWKKPGDIEEVS